MDTSAIVRSAFIGWALASVRDGNQGYSHNQPLGELPTTIDGLSIILKLQMLHRPAGP